jgi:hypothetical protein
MGVISTTLLIVREPMPLSKRPITRSDDGYFGCGFAGIPALAASFPPPVFVPRHLPLANG